MIRRASHRKPVGEHHLHKWGISLRYLRAVIASPSAWCQNLSCFGEGIYPTHSVTCQDFGVGCETRMAGPVVDGVGAERFLVVVPFAAILFERIETSCFCAGVKDAKRQSPPDGVDTVVEAMMRHQQGS